MPTLTNNINDKVGGSNSGATNTFTLTNDSNTASSKANEVISVAGATADDPFVSYVVTGVTTWSIGVDNSDSDKFKISTSATLGSSDAVTVDTSGNVVVTGSTTSRRPIVTASAGKTYALTDANTFQLSTSAIGISHTIPPNANTAFPIGTEIYVYQQGAGQVTFNPGVGVTLNSAFSNRRIALRFTGACLKKTATNVWEITGNLTA